MLAVVFDDRNSERIETYLFFLTLAFWWKTLLRFLLNGYSWFFAILSLQKKNYSRVIPWLPCSLITCTKREVGNF